jgi:broad specificity phosphatase PhoE
LWDIEQNHPLGGAYAAGRALQALREIRSRQRQGRVAACSHGDVVPALVAALAGIHGLEAPPPHDRRGGWHTLRLDGDAIEIELQPLLPDFPN